MDQYQQVIHKSRYARYRHDLNRRETWEETVQRYISFFKAHVTSNFSKKKASLIPWDELQQAILNMEIMPSMRCLMTAGPALERDHVAGYNCAYLPIEHQRCFDEAMYILLCGTGVGFSVERQYVNKLPEVPDELHITETTIVVRDSKIGWASATRELIGLLYGGLVPRWDMGRVRPAGSPLVTFGGRASGPEPLEDLFKFTVKVFTGARGRKLTSLECHDLMCKIADVVVVGGVRRSALISLSNLTDERMRHAKSGEWWRDNGQRALANNSVAYTEKPDMGVFMREWESLYASKAGERGIFSRPAAKAKAARNGRRDADYDFGTNPCSEIILRPYQFCNLSEVVARPDDTCESLARKVSLATILGTIQSTLTGFRYLSKKWCDNTEEERLLGVSLTGICDSILVESDEITEGTLNGLRDVAISEDIRLAEILDIRGSAAITCVKPSGTVSQLVNSASGIHPRFAQHYIRRIRFDASDPMAKFMIERGFPHEDDFQNKSAVVFSFPMESPEGSTVREDFTAVGQLELWAAFQEGWCEHKPSQTIYVREDEWLEVGAWVYKHFDTISGVSFLPFDSGNYRQPPYEKITKEEYEALLVTMPKDVNWLEMKEFEDVTTATQELNCSANGGCEIL